MSYVESLFKNADINGDNILNEKEVKIFVESLFEGREPTDEELCEVRSNELNLLSILCCVFENIRSDLICRIHFLLIS